MAKCDVCRKRLPPETEGICPECLAGESEVTVYYDDEGKVIPVRKINKKIPWRKEWDQ